MKKPVGDRERRLLLFSRASCCCWAAHHSSLAAASKNDILLIITMSGNECFCAVSVINVNKTEKSKDLQTLKLERLCFTLNLLWPWRLGCKLNLQKKARGRWILHSNIKKMGSIRQRKVTSELRIDKDGQTLVSHMCFKI